MPDLPPPDLHPANLRPADPHALPVAGVARQLHTSAETGLSPDTARARLAAHGPNRLRAHRRKGVASLLRHQVKSLMVWLLAAAAGLSFAFGETVEGVAILIVLAINATIGFVTEWRATRAMEALLRMAPLRTRVRRGGATLRIEAQDLVPGDIVLLEAGDVVAADLRLCRATRLMADESILTGEALPTEKTTDPCRADAPLPDRACMAFTGTAITGGSGEGIVVATGMETEFGKISALTETAEGAVAPLERRMDLLGRKLVWLTLGLAFLTTLTGVLHGQDLYAMIQTGVALAVAAVPEGLPVVATLCLARGMWRISAQNAVITRLSSAETLGATTLILTDKTGTLTENRMTVVRMVLNGTEVEVDTRDTLHPFRSAAVPIEAGDDPRLAWALRVGALCSTAALGKGGRSEHAGDPMEIALLSLAHAAGVRREDLLALFPEVGQHPFDPARKAMATVHTRGRGNLHAVKGAPETVLPLCSHVLSARGSVNRLDETVRNRWLAHSASLGAQGLRLLALAMKQDCTTQADPFRGLVLLGLVGLRDPVRKDVPAAIRACRTAGVRVVMLTGDHADTAATIARQAGLADGAPSVIEGCTLAGIDLETLDADRRRQILQADVFARVEPETKLGLVRFFQREGHVVAMTGDGVNDAPALKAADIGIAMGLRGTEVAKEAADMVLRDDAFATIVAAMRQGRIIFANIRRFVIYLMACNVSEVLVVGLAVGAGLPPPLLPLQILYLNLVTDVFPAFALGLGRGNPEVMQAPPRPPDEAIVTRHHWAQIALLSGAITLATLAAFGMALFGLGLAAEQAVTVAFLTLALGQVWSVFNLRDPHAGPIRNDVVENPLVWGAIGLCLGLIAAALWLPSLAQVMGLAPPGLPGLGVTVVASLVPLVVGQLALLWHQRGA